MQRESKEIAREIISNYLTSTSNFNVSIMSEAVRVRHDDKILLEHIKELKNIFEEAIKEIENDNT